MRKEIEPTYNLLFQMDDAAMSMLKSMVNFNNSPCSAYKDADGIEHFIKGVGGKTKGLKDINEDLMDPASVTQKAAQFMKENVSEKLRNSIDGAVENIPSYNAMIGNKIEVPKKNLGNDDLYKRVTGAMEEARLSMVAEHQLIKDELASYLDVENTLDKGLLDKITENPLSNLQNAVRLWENNSILGCVYKDHQVNGVTDGSSFAKEILRRVKVHMTKRKSSRNKVDPVIGDSESEKIHFLVREFLSPNSSNVGSFADRLANLENMLNKNKTTAAKMMLDTNGIPNTIISAGSSGLVNYIKNFVNSCMARTDKKDGRTIASVRAKVMEIGEKARSNQKIYRDKIKLLISENIVTCSNKRIATKYGSPKDCDANTFDFKNEQFCLANTDKCANSLMQCRNFIGGFYTAKTAELNLKRDKINTHVRNKLKGIQQENQDLMKIETNIVEKLGFPLAFYPDLKKLKDYKYKTPEEVENKNFGKPNLVPPILTFGNIEENLKDTINVVLESYKDLESKIEEGTKKVSNALKDTVKESMTNVTDYIAECERTFKGYQDAKLAQVKQQEGVGKDRAKYNVFCSQVNSMLRSVKGDYLPCTKKLDSLVATLGEFSIGEYDDFIDATLEICAVKKLSDDCKESLVQGPAGSTNNKCDKEKERYKQYFDPATDKLKLDVKTRLMGVGERSSRSCIDYLSQENKEINYDEKGDSSGKSGNVI